MTAFVALLSLDSIAIDDCVRTFDVGLRMSIDGRRMRIDEIWEDQGGFLTEKIHAGIVCIEQRQ